MSDAPSLRDWLARASTTLQQVGIDQAEADSAWIASHVLGLGRGQMEVVAATSDSPLDAEAFRVMEQMLSRRRAREPLWHIVGKAPFMGLELSVGPGVFSPRPETELLAQSAITELMAMVPSGDSLSVCDVGAGSGAIGLAIVHAVPHASVVSVEPSDDARVFLQHNVQTLGLGRVDVVDASARDASEHLRAGSLDMVVSNPPYLDRDTDWLDPETAGYDPDSALFADDGGLAVMADVVEFAREGLRPGGVLLVEHGIGHNTPVAKLMVSAGFGLITHHNDMTGRPRFTQATKS